jgi:hypothetical protein
MDKAIRSRVVTAGLLVAAFVAGYVRGPGTPPPASADVAGDRLKLLEENLETLRRAWNVSHEATRRNLRLEPDAQGRYRVTGASSRAETDQRLELARMTADDAYQRGAQPPTSSP